MYKMNKTFLKRLTTIAAAALTIALTPVCVCSADAVASASVSATVTAQTPKISISSLRATIPYLNYTYTGKAITPEPTLKINGVKLVKGKDYTVSYKNNTAIGQLKATVTLSGIGKYTGTTTRYFNINQRPVSSSTITGIKDAFYNGKAVKQSPVIKYGSCTFKNGDDYTLSYSNNTAVGTATVKITGKNRLTGTKSVTFKIKQWDIKKDLGAKGDNSSDDYKAFYNALVKAKNMPSGEKLEVYVPAGKYRISKTLGIYSNTKLVLDKNAQIINCTQNKSLLSVMGNNGEADGFMDYTEAHDITIEGGIWDGNGGVKTEAKGIMVFRNSSRITIKNAVFTKVYGSHYLICDGISDLKVTGCTFKDYVPYTGSWKTYDFTRYTTSEGARKSNIGAVEAVHIDFADDKTPCRNVEVSGCTFDDVPAGVGTHHINSRKGSNIKVHDNTFKNIWFSCMHASSFNSVKMYNNKATNSGLLFRCEDSEAEVYNNTFTGLSKIPSSRYNTDETIYSVLVMQGSKVNFHVNSLKNIKGTGILFSGNGSKENTVKDNVIDNCTLNGMYIGDSTVKVTYNDIRNCGRNGISAGGSKVIVTNNSITKCGASAVYLSGGCYSSTVKNNGITSGSYIGKSSDSSASIADNKPSISGYKATIPYASYTYSGSAIKPKVTVKNGSSKVSSSNYTVTYKNNTKVGTATIIIEGKGSYRGFIRKTFVVKPKPQTLTLKAAKAAFIASWPQDTQASGYMVTYSKDKNFKTGVYSYTVSSNTKTKVTFNSKPKSGETWYVKYRAFVKIGSSKYGNYSAVKSIKTL